MDMIEDVYNHRNRNKIPLAFLAREAARKRIPETLRWSDDDGETF
jgi:hypothetical protein